MQEVSKQVEQATAAATAGAGTAPPPEKVVVRDGSLLGDLASTTPGVLLQVGYAGVLAFMLLAHRNTSRRQIMRIPAAFHTRVRLARVMRDINERVGHYLFSLAVIYAGVAAVATAGAGAAGLPQCHHVGRADGHRELRAVHRPAGDDRRWSPLVALLTFDDWLRILAAPVALLVIHVVESQFDHAAVPEPALRPQHRGGVRLDRAARLDVGADRRHRGGAAPDPAQHHRRPSAVAALAGSAAGGRPAGAAPSWRASRRWPRRRGRPSSRAAGQPRQPRRRLAAAK